MKRSTKQLIAIIIIAICIGGGAIVIATTQNTNTTQQQAQKTTTDITYTAKPGLTSLEQLKQEARDVVTSTSQYGELVTSIEGHTAGDEGKYWSFYVNNEMAQVGADSYVQQKGDVIEWKFQKL